MVRWVVGSILHGVDPLSYFSFQPVLHDWCNKGRGMCYPVCGMVHIKEPLLLIDKSSLCGGSGFPFSLSEWSFTICLTPYNRKYNVLSASLNKTFLSLSLDCPSLKIPDHDPWPVWCTSSVLCIVERTGGGEEREDPAPGTGVQEHAEEYWVGSPHGQAEGTQSVREGAGRSSEVER